MKSPVTFDGTNSFLRLEEQIKREELKEENEPVEKTVEISTENEEVLTAEDYMEE